MQQQPLRILLVEDQPASVFLFREALRHPDMPQVELLLAYDADSALEIARRSGRDAHAPRPDLIVLDLRLPIRDGFELLREIRSDPANSVTPVCVLTSSEREEDIAAAYDLGANCYVVKPVAYQSFLRTVRNVIRFWSRVVRSSTMALLAMVLLRR